ncbi:glucose-6-phosphate isomerase [Croceicoccus gelatinilyticus]|uniref:glucose-6-phosphate isomerase n=1 Tax=Croceicoccus gelatinilyticus TaxID=2835536 RepID=UPI001BD13A4A|nr:glucose-6-phosphate isomerase [Croceicoccus gelatinilyticus]MBS7670401.1 glucose-6-phosphate isomerase [Croceicoccus gelatinilyticus]
MTDTAACWTALENTPTATLKELFAADANRVGTYSATLTVEESEVYFDWSKTHLSADLVAKFEALARAAGFNAARETMLGGGMANPTEGRAAEHTAQRGIGADESVAEADAFHMRMRGLVEAIHEGVFGPVKHLIHIGIGGSALGPALAIDALARPTAEWRAPVDVHVVSNIDGNALEAAFEVCDPATTMIAVASKTFTTIETMTNAASAIQWLEESGVSDPYGKVVALTASPDKAVEWGVDETRVLPFSQSVGGRYSLWSSIGFPVAIALGWDGFAAFLEGAAAVDRHFADTDGFANLPLRAAFVDLMYVQLRGCQTRAVFAYDERLALFPDYLQQLEMESNGKSVLTDGSALGRQSAPITWGGVGTDAQHAVFQLLHQGTVEVPVDFIAVKQAGHDLDPEHHAILLTNCFAQGAALMAGKESDDGARAYPGNRPSTTILCDRMDPATLGALIAFHEHRTFANAVLLGINPFDQFGVELGKQIANQIAAGGGEGFDPSTEALLAAAGLKD